MSAFLYALHRELFCLNVDDYEVQNGLQLKQIASECCGVSLDSIAVHNLLPKCNKKTSNSVSIITELHGVKLMYQSIPKPPIPPPGQTPGNLTFLKNFGQIPRYIVSLDGQMPHPLELQRGSNLLDTKSTVTGN